ncbi:glycosyltransferase [uncultured Thiodictyon sp.]|uniref:glycosyltransferase family 2 protein n=1 Tax=uncultured Thiodictyon sp. TaxID=1846217 RepID=UPI0025F48F1F|nr:glycosyltransferase [uncultured Thiodictyon sp.]
MKITVAIPSYGRDHVLVDTLREVLNLSPPPAEVLVLDQTRAHTSDVETMLREWDAAGGIRWLRLTEPSITRAMNQGLLAASNDIVLFLDDDIHPEPALLRAHLAAHRDTAATLVAGRVIQPWQAGVDVSKDTRFHFASLRPAWITQFMGGNFSIRRKAALDLGGFDENFVRVAYRFEAEFAYRLDRAGHRIYFEPAASLYHLKVATGGTRSFGEHLTTFKPDHAVGAYYCCLRTWSGWPSLGGFLATAARSVATRHHLRRPWWIPVTLVAQLLGMGWALGLYLSGPRYLRPPSAGAPH